MPYVQDPPDVKFIRDPHTPSLDVVRAVEITEDVREDKFDVYLYYGRAGDQPDGEVLVQVYEDRQTSPRTTVLYRLSEFSHGAIPNDLLAFLKPVRYSPELIAELIWACKP